MVKSESHFKKHIFSNFSFLRRHFFGFSVFSCFLGCASNNTCFMLRLGPWACHCGPTFRPLGPGRANPLHVFPVFCFSHFFDSFACFPSCLAPPLVKNGIQKLPFARRWLPVGPRMRTNDTRTTRRTTKRQKQRNDEGGNDKTTPPICKSFLRPGGMRACALNPPPPLGDEAC